MYMYTIFNMKVIFKENIEFTLITENLKKPTDIKLVQTKLLHLQIWLCPLTLTFILVKAVVSRKEEDRSNAFLMN